VTVVEPGTAPADPGTEASAAASRPV